MKVNLTSISFFIIALSIGYYLVIYLPNQNKQTSTTSTLSSSFVCPENYQTAQDMTNATVKFIADYQKEFPQSTLGDLEIYRYHLLVSHSCKETLSNVLTNVSPMNLMVRFQNKDFGPQKTEFTKDTNVLSSYLTLNRQLLTSPEEELIFNFYLENVWSTGTISAEHVAQVVANSYGQSNDSKVIYKFTAPDPLTKNPDYVIYSYISTPQENYSYVYITKISSVQNSVFSVTYAKKISDTDSKNLENDVNAWVLGDTKATNGVSTQLINVNVSNDWLSYLTRK